MGVQLLLQLSDIVIQVVQLSLQVGCVVRVGGTDSAPRHEGLAVEAAAG
jgi:hypothetical protein